MKNLLEMVEERKGRKKQIKECVKLREECGKINGVGLELYFLVPNPFYLNLGHKLHGACIGKLHIKMHVIY